MANSVRTHGRLPHRRTSVARTELGCRLGVASAARGRCSWRSLLVRRRVVREAGRLFSCTPSRPSPAQHKRPLTPPRRLNLMLPPRADRIPACRGGRRPFPPPGGLVAAAPGCVSGRPGATAATACADGGTVELPPQGGAFSSRHTDVSPSGAWAPSSKRLNRPDV